MKAGTRTLTKIIITLLIISFGIIHPLASQTVLSGKALDENSNPVSNINILVYEHGSQALIAFAITSGDGSFKITLSSQADSLRVEATSLQYRRELLLIANQAQQLEINLVTEPLNLDEVIVKASPIEQRGDTISYMVSSFAREQDRSIADVLQTMPGIEVEPSGRILYQGDPIQNFYVEGLDLMSGRYGLISENMPHKSVATVQILENHQPLKILEERIPSARTSLNLTLKREVTTTGTAKLGSGALPVLWDANITPMLFTRNIQVAGSYQANNTGNDAARQLDMLTLGSLRQQAEVNTTRSNLLNIPSVAPPGFNENRYLDNNIHLLNANILIKLANDLQLRTNIHFIHDRQEQAAHTQSTVFTPTDTIRYSESASNQLRKSSLRSEINLTRNTRANYLNNKLEFQNHWDWKKGTINLNNDILSQELNDPFLNLSNQLNIIKPVGNHFIEINSLIFFDQNSQQLNVDPALIGESADTVGLNAIQDTRLRRIITDNSAGISFGLGKVAVTPRVGFQFHQSQLNHNLLTSANIPTDASSASVTNGNRFKSYINTELVYKYGPRFSVTLDLPFSHNLIRVVPDDNSDSQRVEKLYMEPRFSTEYRFANFWRFRGTFNHSQILGETDDIHYEYIMKNYRNLHINNAPVNQGSRNSFSTFLGYRNPINATFSSLAYTYGISNNNLLYKTIIQPNGSTLQTGIQQFNRSHMHNVSARVSQFFNPVKTTLSLQGTYMRNNNKQLVNDLLFDGMMEVITLSPKANINITPSITADIKSEWIYYQTFREKELLNNVNIWKYFGNILVFIAQNQHIALYSEYYRLSGNNNYFFDLHYRYTLKDRKIDIDLRWINILNQKNYRDFSVGTYTLLENEYILRPTQLVLAVKFSF